MLRIESQHGPRDCGGASRRDFLRLGALSFGGLSLPWLLQQRAHAQAAGLDYVNDKAIVLLFCCGGPSHIETFDPHMEALEPIRSMTGEVRTALPGVTFGSTYKGLAKRASRLAVVRSYSPHEISDHATAIRHVLKAGDPLGNDASMGAMLTRMAGAGAARGMPAFVELIRNEIEDEYQQDMQRMRVGNDAGGLAPACAPFAPNAGAQSQLGRDMTLGLPLERLDDRRALLQSIDRLNRAADASGAMAALDAYHQQAVGMLLGGSMRAALDLSNEDPKVVARYDTSHMRSGWLNKRPSTLGKRLLTARRLVEAGCRFVTVGMAGWDNHGNKKHPGVVDGMRVLGSPLDHAVSAFLDDVQARGLSDKVLLVITGEFGRTPTKIQAQGGRDHWPGLCSLAFAGGGLNMGQTIGQSDRSAMYPDSTPYRLSHLFGTFVHTMFDVGRMRLDPGVPRELMQLAGKVEPIGELF